MGSHSLIRFSVALLTGLSISVLVACNQTSASGTSAVSADSGKVPITTKSEEAKADYLRGVDLSDRLQGNDSIPYFDKAIALDPDFATAELARANNSPTGGVLRT
jgi:hypothetical protein